MEGKGESGGKGGKDGKDGGKDEKVEKVDISAMLEFNGISVSYQN